MSSFMQQVTHGIKRAHLEMGRRMAVYLVALVVVLALVAALYLMLVSQTAAQGRHIQQLQTELFRLQRENEQLEVEVAAMSSVARLRVRAIELGFVPAEQVDFLLPAGE